MYIQFGMENETLLWLLEFPFTISSKKATKYSNRIFFSPLPAKTSSSITVALLFPMLLTLWFDSNIKNQLFTKF